MSGPDPESEQVFTVYHKTYVRVLKDTGECMHVETLGGEHNGWLNRRYIEKTV